MFEQFLVTGIKSNDLANIPTSLSNEINIISGVDISQTRFTQAQQLFNESNWMKKYI